MVGAVCRDLLRDIILYVPLDDLKEFSDASPVIFREIAFAGIRVLSLGDRIIDLRNGITVIRGNNVIDAFKRVPGENILVSLVSMSIMNMSRIRFRIRAAAKVHMVVDIIDGIVLRTGHVKSRDEVEISEYMDVNTGIKKYKEAIRNIDFDSLSYILHSFEDDIKQHSYYGSFKVIFKDSCWIS